MKLAILLCHFLSGLSCWDPERALHCMSLPGAEQVRASKFRNFRDIYASVQFSGRDHQLASS